VGGGVNPRELSAKPVGNLAKRDSFHLDRALCSLLLDKLLYFIDGSFMARKWIIRVNR